ncbi:protein translocase subunit secG [Novosphingobium kunmingense]|uniref:Protein-export membrane protein SecG n=1 Tax=Novosphingobium kunmingense TaxID=1211806 RepID=A0A2N0I2U9_9SPHN|nr:preprotein translocase subunit SecG [Novosphingobium kunmingense]PKB25526.1 protein translocase subunit secG [Novosphingobium kunmingense]
MSSLFLFLMVVQAIVAALLVWVILMQKSEGGGLGVGGSPAGLMSARGAADFLTRSTTILASVFVILSIVLAALAVRSGGTRAIDDSLQRNAPLTAPAQPAPVDPLAGAAGGAPAAEPAAPAASPSASTPADPFALPAQK